MMVTTTLEIKASAQQIWDALTNKEQQKVWYFDIPNFSTTIGTVFDFFESDEKQYFHRCEVLESVEHQLFKHTWTHPNESKGTSVVTWTIEEKGENCTVTLTHEGLESFADGGPTFAPQNYQMGWDAILKTNLRNFITGITRLKFEIDICASPDKIWEVMWNKETYQAWTTPFCEGSHYTGDITQGGRIHFLMPNGNGMYSNVLFCKEPITVIFSHIGDIKNHVEQPLDETSKQWTGCMEMYQLKALDNGIHRLTAEVDCTANHIAHMNDKFPLGLAKIKELSED